MAVRTRNRSFTFGGMFLSLSLAQLGCGSGASATPEICYDCEAPPFVDGSPCRADLECRFGSLCLRDGSREVGVCTPISCSRSQITCRPPETCDLRGLCSVPACQAAEDCGPDETCVRGACVSRSTLPAVRDCAVWTRGSSFVGQTVEPVAVPFDDSGEVIGGDLPTELRFEPADSFQQVGTQRWVANASVQALVRGTVGGVECSRAATSRVFGPPGAQVRIVVGVSGAADPASGLPIDVVTRSQRTKVRTSSAGVAMLNPFRGPVSLFAHSQQTTAILDLPAADLYVSLPKDPDDGRPIRGWIDRSTVPSELGSWLALAGLPVSPNLLDLSLGSFLGSSRMVQVDYLGGSRLPVPMGFLLGRVGEAPPMDDSATEGFRCPRPGGEGELGCFRLNSRRPAFVWAIGAAGEFNTEYGALNVLGGSQFAVRYLEAVNGPLENARSSYRVVLDSETTDPQLAPSRTDLMTLVRLPRLPTHMREAHAEVLIGTWLSGLYGELGLIPLGLTTKVSNLENLGGEGLRPYGHSSSWLIPIAVTAPPSSPSSFVVMTFAADAGSWLAGRPVRQAWVFQRIDGRLDETLPEPGPFLEIPHAVLDRHRHVLDFESLDPSATVVVLEVDGPGGRWRVFSRAQTHIGLPSEAVARARSGTVTIARTQLGWDELWALRNVGKGFEVPGLNAVSRSPCGTTSDAPCQIE